MRSLCLAVLLFGAYAATPPVLHNAPSPSILQMTQGDDTLLAAPWIQAQQMRAWTPETRAAFCISSYATWPRFYFIRHVTAPAGRDCPGETPVFMQGPCPERLAPNARPSFVIVQCGPNQFRLYHRNLVKSARAH